MEFLGDRRLDGMGLLPDTVKYAYGTFDKIEIASQQSAFLPLVGSTGPLSGYISSSTFTCPIDGVYSISAYFGTTDPNNGEGINTHIQVDHHDGYGWVNVGGLSNMNPTIRTPQVCMVLPLKKGDGIAIKIANIGVSTRSYCDHFTTVGSSDAGLPNWCIALIEQSVPAIVADSHYVQSSDELYEVRIDPSTGIMSPNGMFIKEIPNKFWDWLETNGFRDLTLPAERFNELGLTDYNNGRTIYIGWKAININTPGLPPLPMTITGTLTTYDISVIMTPIGNMGYEVKLQYGHVSGVLYDVNTVLMEYIGRWHMSSATVTKWSGWFQRVLSNNNELELSKRRIVYGNVSNACWLPLGTMTVPTGINSQRQVAIQFYGGRAASFNTHYAGTFALSINTGETTTNVQGRLHYDQVTQPTISLRPRFGYSGTPNVKGSVMTIWLYADGGWPFLYYNNITTTDSSMGVVLRANGTITDGIVTTAPSGWTEITAS